MKMFRKNLCDKVSRMKILRLLSFSFFRADRRGVLRFFGRRIFHGENRETKSPYWGQFQATHHFSILCICLIQKNFLLTPTVVDQ